MTDRENRLVWYASYGSNCSRARFITYLKGGRVPGRDRVQVGARDPRPPRDDAPHEFGQQIRFVGHSPIWGGAPAFLEHQGADPGALGRRYLISWDQLDDVVAQESQRTRTQLPLSALNEGARATIGPGRYDCLVGLTPVGGVPVVTFTSPDPAENCEAAPPSGSYLATIVHGLAESHRQTTTQIGERLRLVAEVSRHWTISDIALLPAP